MGSTMSFWVDHGQLIPVSLEGKACRLEDEKQIGVQLICAQRQLVSAQLPIRLVRSASSP